jgi:hypothetical protein
LAALYLLHGSDEAIAALGQGFDEPRIFGRIPQRGPDLFDGRVEAQLRIHQGVFRPKLALQLLACQQLARSGYQQSQNLKGLLLQIDLDPALTQFSGSEIDFVHAELNSWRRPMSRFISSYSFLQSPALRPNRQR